MMTVAHSSDGAACSGGLMSFLAACAVLAASIGGLAWRRRPSALMAVVLAGCGCALPPLWDWGRQGAYHWSGLPPTMRLAAEQEAEVRWIFTVAGLACLFVSIAVAFEAPRMSARQSSRNLVDMIARDSRPLIRANVLVMMIWVAGQGPSLLSRTEYLATDGITFLLRLSLALAVPLLLINACLISRRSLSPTMARALGTLQIVWGFLATSTGSRMGLIALVTLAMAMASRKKFVVAGVVTLAALVSVGLAHDARGQVHGVIPTIEVLANGEAAEKLAPDEIDRSIKGIAMSIGAAAPVVAMTVGREMSAGDTMAIANPAPRSLGLAPDNLNDILQKRQYLLPWVPTAAIGEMRAVGGLWLIASVFLIVALAADGLHAAAARRLQGRRSALASPLVAHGFAVAITMCSIQYAGRQFWRLALIEMALLVAVLLTSAVRQGSPDSRTSASQRST